MKSRYINLGVYLLTLIAVGLYAWKGAYNPTASLIMSAVLMAGMLIVLSIAGWKKRFSKLFPIFAIFWSILYVLIPAAGSFAINLDAEADLFSFFFGRHSVTSMIIALVSLSVAFILLLIKNRHSTILIFFRYVFVSVFLYIFNAAAQNAIFYNGIRSGYESLFVVPAIIGAICFIREIRGSIYAEESPCMKIFLPLAFMYELIIPLISQRGIINRLEMLLLMEEWGLIIAAAAVSAGLILLDELLIKKRNNAPKAEELTPEEQLHSAQTEYDSVSDENTLKIGNIPRWLQLFIWIGYIAIIKFFFPICENSYVLWLGIPLAALAYDFYKVKQKGLLVPDEKLKFDWKAWLILIPAVIALGRVTNEKLTVLAFGAALLLAYLICLQIANSNTDSVIMTCFAGVAAVILKFAFSVEVEEFSISDSIPDIIAVLALSAVWCIICTSLKKATRNTAGVNEKEYSIITIINKYVPAAVFAAAIIGFIFRP